jgi:GR25 family glycosyltransferase involved in LPS biosynthesis
MRSFIVYVKGHEKSEQYMNSCMSSCLDMGFDAEPLEGVTPATLDQYDQYPEAENGRSTSFKLNNPKTYLTKKSCFTNHIRVWKNCIELNEPVAFIEQDSYCIRKLDSLSFDELLVLNIQSAFKQPVFSHVKNKPYNFDFGVNDYSNSPLIYNKVNSFYGSLMIPGTAAYAISPRGAKRLLDNLEKYGWDQSDFFINTKNVRIQYVYPEYFTFKYPNLNMSHGF